MKIRVRVESDWNEYEGTSSWYWVIKRSTATDTWLDVNRGRTSTGREHAIEAANAVLDRYLAHLGSKPYTKELELEW